MLHAAVHMDGKWRVGSKLPHHSLVDTTSQPLLRVMHRLEQEHYQYHQWHRWSMGQLHNVADIEPQSKHNDVLLKHRGGTQQ